jgi:ankyrin repeat protein
VENGEVNERPLSEFYRELPTIAREKALIFSGISPYAIDQVCLYAQRLGEEVFCGSPSFWKKKYFYSFRPLVVPKSGIDEDSKDLRYWRELCFTSYRKARTNILDIFLKMMKKKTPEERNDRALEIIRSGILLEKGARVNEQSEATGTTCLMIATTIEQTEMARLLLSFGADPNLLTTKRLAALPEGSTALMIAAVRGQTEMAQLLLSRGADPNLQSNNGKTALMLASKQGKTETIRLLLSSGADPNLQNRIGQTALILVAVLGKTDMARLLVSSGADPNLQNTLGKTALFYAADLGHTEMVRLLLSNGADPNLQITNGRTTLMFAADRGKMEIIRLLLRNGADVSTKDKKGITASDYALVKGHEDLGKMLKRMEDKGEDLQFADSKVFVF